MLRTGDVLIDDEHKCIYGCGPDVIEIFHRDGTRGSNPPRTSRNDDVLNKRTRAYTPTASLFLGVIYVPMR